MNKQPRPSSNRQATIHVVSLGKRYSSGLQHIQVLEDINFEVFPGEMVAIMGPSGCGKSTLLFILGLLLRASGGTYLFEGEDTADFSRSQQAFFRRQRIGFVLQGVDLLENSRVYENIEFPLIYARVQRRKRREKIIRALTRVNLSDRIYHRTNRLSGGEKQRVCIARALVNTPRVILADEPTGQLDEKNTLKIMQYFNRIVADGKTSIVVVTHDSEVAAQCGRILKLRDGRLVEEEAS